MHMGGGGGGHGGGGHGAGGHGHGGHHGGHATHHSGQSHSQPIAAHNLGGHAQSVVGHVTSLVQNNQGVLGHIASWLTGQHHGAGHHAGAGQNQHVGDASWTSAALQIEKKPLTMAQKVMKIPGISILGVFFVIAGWLFFLGYLRHGDSEHVARSPMPTQQEWRQQLVGNQAAPAQADGQQQPDDQGAVSAGVSGGASPFGAPREIEGAVMPQFSPQPTAFTPTGYAPTNYAPAPGAYGAPVAAAEPASSAPPASYPSAGRARSFSASAAANPAAMAAAAVPVSAGDLYAPIESRRNFRHRVVAER